VDYLITFEMRRLSWSRSLRVLHSTTVDCPAFDEMELLRVDLAEEAWGDEPFNQSGETSGCFPRSFDPDATLSPHRVDVKLVTAPLSG
jgi:hypothetical protein